MSKLKDIPIQQDERQRVLSLTELDLDYSELKSYLSDLTGLASRISGAGISLVNLIDSYTQWTVSSEGLDIDQMDRNDSVCRITIQQTDDFEVEDLTRDYRFSDKFYVTGDPYLKYYYGIPLVSKSGYHIGALCVLDQEKVELDPEKKEMLKMISREIVNRITFLKEQKMLREQINAITSTQRKVSHDIRGPITGIIGLADIIHNDVEERDMHDLLELILLIRKGGESVLELADGIMNQGRGRQEPGKDEFSCSTFCEKLRQLYKPQAVNKNIELMISYFLRSDKLTFPKSRLLQIAGNLISNSIKFTPEGGKVEATIGMGEKPHGIPNILQIEVRDTGCGMTDEQIRDIYQQAEHVTTPGTNGETGYGFGLMLVQHLIRKAGGTLEIQSEGGSGTIMNVSLPVAG